VHAYSHKPTLLVNFQVESLNFLLGLQRSIGGLTDSMWEQLRQALSEILSYLQEVSQDYREFELSFCELQANGLSSILWLVMNAFSFSGIPLFDVSL
jgi:hypothetical protein